MNSLSLYLTFNLSLVFKIINKDVVYNSVYYRKNTMEIVWLNVFNLKLYNKPVNI